MSEQPEKTKAELFAENPDRFVDTTGLLFAIQRHPEKNILGHFINVGKEGMEIHEVYEEALKIKAFAEHKINTFLLGLDAQIIQRNKATAIVKPNGKPHFFANGFRK